MFAKAHKESRPHSAEEVCDELSKISPLSDSQKIDLAKWLTIYGNSGTTDTGRAALSNGTASNGISYAELAYKNGISIKWDSAKTIVGNQVYDWANNSISTGLDSSAPEASRIANIKSIENAF